MGRWILSRLLLAALTALLVWAFVVGVFGKFLSHPERFFGIKEPETSLSSEGEDVLFDDDSTVDWSDPVTDVFDSSGVSQAPSGGDSKDPEPKPKYYEFIMTPDYFDALLLRYSDGLPIYRISSSFSEGAIVLKGEASVDALAELAGKAADVVPILSRHLNAGLARMGNLIREDYRSYFILDEGDNDFWVDYNRRLLEYKGQ